ncbi:YmfL family putative regulatory protein [Vibrio casei]|uniref:Uncharacterized protein n=1 Tax=Vibrio casei TaxID=673372 RepID=A0A368LHK8_9VIBR|nr:YmfL family putative regulatory protein [Vibrio casei]RCS70151.1 hypothetical protein CIK83_11845 [Vibrio casei]SJN24297.1 Orf33 [Vibrio casei]
MVAQFESLKEAILKSEKSFSGGRAEIARQMGLSYDAYRNRLREDREDQQFSASQLEDIQFITGTAYVAQYFANKAGQMTVAIPSSDVDGEELSEIQIGEAAAIGGLSVIIAQALADGQIDNNEAKLIDEATLNAVAKLMGKSSSIIQLYRG